MKIVFDETDTLDPRLKERISNLEFKLISWAKSISTRKVKNENTYKTEVCYNKPIRWTFKLDTTKTHGELTHQPIKQPKE